MTHRTTTRFHPDIYPELVVPKAEAIDGLRVEAANYVLSMRVRIEYDTKILEESPD